jgi:hypothetical protein
MTTSTAVANSTDGLSDDHGYAHRAEAKSHFPHLSQRCLATDGYLAVTPLMR